MSEEQFKASETEATAQVEENVDEEISEDDLEGVAGGASHLLGQGVGAEIVPRRLGDSGSLPVFRSDG
jgi:hypothetical protein